MASLLIGASVLTYSSIKNTTAKRRAKRASHNSARFSELERENAARIARLQSSTCFCQTSDWRGGGCEVHGYVPPGGPPAYVEESEERPRVQQRRMSMPGEGAGGSMGTGTTPYHYVRGQEDGVLAEQKEPVRMHERAPHSQSMGDLTDEGWTRTPGPMGEEEVRRINEERRKRLRSRGLAGFVGRWRRDKRKMERERERVVR